MLLFHFYVSTEWPGFCYGANRRDRMRGETISFAGLLMASLDYVPALSVCCVWAFARVFVVFGGAVPMAVLRAL